MTAIPAKTLAGGFSMPTYGIGTWQFGGRTTRDPANDDDADVRALVTALEAGVTHVDVAETYAAGHAERLVGRAIRGFDRGSLFLASKVSAPHQRPGDLLRSFDASCDRLGTDYLDLYMPHSYASGVPIDETMDALGRLVESGRLRHVGVSNFNAPRLRAAQAASRHPIVANQLHYSLRVREIERAGLLAYCQAVGVMVVAWGPLRGVPLDAPVLARLAGKYGKTPAQVALNWLMSQPGVVAIAKTGTRAHLVENLGALGWRMSYDDVEALRAQMPGQLGVSDREPLNYP